MKLSKHAKTKSIFDQEFSLVNDGLNEEQVITFVNEIMKQRDGLLKEHEHLNSLRTLAEKTVIEADELAQDIRSQVQAETMKMVSEAEEKARNLVAEGQTQAREEATQILQQARQEALVITETAKKKISSRIEDILEKFRPSLQNIVSGLDANNEIFNDIDKSLTGSVISELTPTSDVSDKLDSNDNNKQDHQTSLDNSLVESTTSKFNPISDKLAPTCSNNHNKRGHNTSQDSDIISQAKNILDNNLGNATATAVANNTQTAISPDIYQGEVSISVIPPVDIAQLIKLRRNLESITHLKILATAGSYDEGSTITLNIDKPLSLIRILGVIPEVDRVELGSANNYDESFTLGATVKQNEKIFVFLKKSS